MDLLVITDPEEVIKLSSRETNLPKAGLFYKAINTVRLCLILSLLPCQAHLNILLANGTYSCHARP